MVLENFLVDADILWDRAGKDLYEKPEARAGRKMRVRVTNRGVVEDLTGYTLNLGWISTSDETKFGLDAFDVVGATEGIFELDYTSGMLTNIGNLKAVLQLVPLAGEPTESNNFMITVKKSALDPGAVQSETSFTALEVALVQVNGWNATIGGKVEDWEADMAATKQLYIDNMEEVELTYPQELNSLSQQLAQVKDVDIDRVKQEVTPLLSRSGTPWNEVSLTKAIASTPITLDLDVLSSPDFEFKSFKPAGIDPEGYAVEQNGARRTNDGAKTFQTITSGGRISQFVWFDEQGNAYSSIGKEIFRSPASSGYVTYNFVKVAEIDNEFLTGFSFAQDGLGGVYFAGYSFTATSNNFMYSHDWGLTFTKKIIVFNQRHFHTVHYHKPSGNLYLVVGENGTWRGILKSIDRGVNFTQIATLENSIQPITATTRGKYILWGQDSVPSGFTLHNTEDDTMVRIEAHNSVGSVSVNMAGFYYSKVEHDGVLISPVRAEAGYLDSVYPMVAIDGIKNPMAVFNAYGDGTLSGSWIFGVDAGGYSYLIDKANTGSYVFGKLKKTTHTFYATSKSETVEVVEMAKTPSYQYEGVNVRTINHGGSGVNDLSPGYRVVVPGDRYSLVGLVKRGVSGSSTVRLVAFQKMANASYTSVYFEMAMTKIPLDDKFHKVTFNYTVPVSVAEVRFMWESYGGTNVPENIHYTTPVLIQKQTDTDVRYTLGNAEDKFKFEKSVSANFLLKDIIYNTGSSSHYEVGKEMPILKMNTIEVGLKKKTTVTGECHLYIKQGGVLISETLCGQYGGVLDGEIAYKHRLSNLQQMGLRPAPIRIGLTEKTIIVYSSETGQTFEYSLLSPVVGFVEVELLGSCYHSPAVYQNVRADESKTYLLNDQ